MKLRTFFMAVMAGAALLVGCNKEVDFGPAKVALDQTNLAFEVAGGSQAVSLTATRDWAVNGVPEWVAVSATNGQAAVEAQPLKITVTQNAAYDRSATLVFTIGFARTSLTINQAGPNGQVDNGDGTLENPYNVTGVIEYLNELGADVNSPKKVFVKGKVSALASKESDQFGGTGNTFGNGSFTMSDDGSVNGGQFTAYRINYLGNKKFAAGDTPVKVGDEVIVYGNVVNYKGNTPETQQNQAFLYSLNGENRGGVDAGSGEDGEAKGSGTLEDPFNPAGIAAVAENLADNAVSEQSYYMKGKISKIAVSKGVDQTFANSGSYGNASFYIADAEDGTGEFYIYQTYYLGNRKWVTGDTDIKVGDEVIVYGPVTKYVSSYGTTLETSGKGASYIYSLNGVTEGGGDQPGGDETEYTYEAVTGSTIKVNNEISWSEATDATYGKGFEAVSGNIKLGLYKHEGNVDLKTPDQYSARVYVSSVFVVSTVDGSDLTAIEFTASDPYNETDYAQPLKVLEGGNGTVPANTETKKIGTWKGAASKVVFQAALKQVRLVSMTYAPGDGGGDEPGDEPGDVTPGTAGTYSFQFSDVSALSWPTAKGAGASTQVYPLNGVNYTFTLSDNVYTSTYSGSSYLMLASKTAAAPVYLGLPALEGLRLVKVAVTTSSGASKSAHGVVTSDLSGTVVSGGEDKTLSEQSTEYTWKLTGTEVGKVYYYSSPSASYNSQIVKLDLTYSDGEGGDEPGGDEPGGDEPSDEYANAPAKTVEEFIQLADKENYYKLTGTVSKFNPTYCSFDLTDASGTIYVYSVLAAYKTDEWKNKIKDGGTITIAGKYEYYANKSQHEVVNAALLSFTDAEGGDQPGTDEPSLPVNDGLTEATAFTVQDAIYMAKNGTEDKEYFVKAVVGKDISIKNGTASFELVDGTTDGKLTVVKAKSFGGEDFANDAPIEWLDEVILKGKVTEYSTLPALVNGQLVKWNGLPVFEAQFKTIAELNALCTATATEYVGMLENAVVSFVPSTSNAIIKDATGSILLYKKDHGLKQGQTFSGLVTVTALMYNGNYTELTAIDAAFIGDEAAVEPQTVTLAKLAEDGYDKWQNAYVTIKNMEVTAVDKKNVSVKGSDWIMFSNAGNATCAVGDMITVTGTVTKFGETLEIKAWTMDAIAKVEPQFSSVAELNAACTSTEQELTGKLTDAVVSFVPNTSNAIIKDAAGSILVYKSGHGLKQGQTFSGWTTVKAVLYNNAGELKDLDATFTGDEAAVEPEALSLATLAADFAKYQNAYVVVENLEVTAVSGKNINVKDGENTYVVYSNAGNATCKVGAVIKATGTVAQYNGNGQIKAWSLDAIEVTKEAPEEEPGGNEPDGKYYVKVTTAPVDWSGKYLLVTETANKAFSGFNGTLGTGADVTISEGKIASTQTVAGYQIVIAKATVTDGAYTIKFADKFLSWSSGNTLVGVDSEDVNANWNLSIATVSENTCVYIANAADAARKLKWNNNSPRFCCYTSAQTEVQLYKLAE